MVKGLRDRQDSWKTDKRAKKQWRHRWRSVRRRGQRDRYDCRETDSKRVKQGEI